MIYAQLENGAALETRCLTPLHFLSASLGGGRTAGGGRSRPRAVLLLVAGMIQTGSLARR